MKLIVKGREPHKFTEWKRENPSLRYRELDHVTRNELHQSLLDEQGCLCAYCCELLHADFSHNEHILPQSRYPNKTLEYENIVASCNNPKQCGHEKGGSTIPLTPLMDECETELKYKVNGLVSGVSDRANRTIETLKLGSEHKQNRSLVNKRKAAIENFLLTSGGGDFWFEDEEILVLLLDDLKDDGLSFAPVIRQVISRYLEGN